MADCVRCGTAVVLPNLSNRPPVCAACVPVVRAANVCPGCGNRKKASADMRRGPAPLFCGECLRRYRNESSVLAHRAQSERLRGEALQREHAEAPDEVAEDPRGTYHRGERLRGSRPGDAQLEEAYLADGAGYHENP